MVNQLNEFQECPCCWFTSTNSGMSQLAGNTPTKPTSTLSPNNPNPDQLWFSSRNIMNQLWYLFSFERPKPTGRDPATPQTRLVLSIQVDTALLRVATHPDGARAADSPGSWNSIRLGTPQVGSVEFGISNSAQHEGNPTQTRF